MARFLGIDVGTSGCKALLIDGEGRVVGRASASYPLHAPEPTWSEQDPEDWWVAVLACIEEIGERRPDAIGLTGQMHGGVFLDADGAVIRPAILWNDQRTEREAAEIEAAVGSDRIRAITGNPMLTGFQLPKLIWLRKEEPEAYGRLRSLLLPKDYVRYRLTGERRSEPSDLSGTGMFDLVRREWSTEILEALDLDGSLLPEVGESFDFGARTRDAPGLDDGVPVVGGGGDQAAGAVGTGAVEPGIVSVSLGTSGVVFATLAEPKIDPDGRVHTFCHATGGWHAMSVMLSCGGALAWARETWFGGESYVAIEELAAAAPPGAQGLTFLPYLSGEGSPHKNTKTKGEMV
jgi:xylulokinase